MGSVLGVIRGDTRCLDNGSYGSFPKLRVQYGVGGVPIMKLVVSRGLYWGPFLGEN